MDFDFSEEQKALQDSARRLLGDLANPIARREIFEAGSGFNEAIWREAGQLGWLATAVDGAYGGLGLGHVTLCAIAEELGRALAATPFLSSIGLAAEAIGLAGAEEQKVRWLPALASGERIATFAVTEAGGALSAETVHSEVFEGRLTGAKIAVVDGMAADWAVVAARSSGNVGLYFVDLGDPGVSRSAQPSLDPSRPLARIVFDRTPVTALEAWRGEGDLLTALLDRAAVIAAFEQLGGAQAALDMAKAYALERQAFGRPIAAFQAMKHKLAEVHVSIELARSQAYYGAWALEAGAPELSVAAACARLSATAAFEQAARELIQVHGGIGMTWEHDSHFFYRRSRHLAVILGAPEQWRETLAARLLDKPGRV